MALALSIERLVEGRGGERWFREGRPSPALRLICSSSLKGRAGPGGLTGIRPRNHR